MVEDKHAIQAQSGELVVSYDLKMMGGGTGPDVKSRVRYYSLSKDRFNKRVFMDDDYTFIGPVDPDPIKLDDSGEVVVLIKTVDGDVYLRSKGE